MTRTSGDVRMSQDPEGQAMSDRDERETAWRAIESAPRDGTDILLHWRGHVRPSIGRWTLDDEDHPNWAHDPEREGWACEGDQCIPTNQEDCAHWMPLPGLPL